MDDGTVRDLTNEERFALCLKAKGSKEYDRPARPELWATVVRQAYGGTLAHYAANHHILPSDFDQWGLADKNGRTVAHAAASWGGLPDDFTLWELTDHEGDTVAHIAARWGHLPRDFALWELTDHEGWTVAHEAAQWGHLPKGFDNWELTNAKGITVREVHDDYLLVKGQYSWPEHRQRGNAR